MMSILITLNIEDVVAGNPLVIANGEKSVAVGNGVVKKKRLVDFGLIQLDGSVHNIIHFLLTF